MRVRVRVRACACVRACVRVCECVCVCVCVIYKPGDSNQENRLFLIGVSRIEYEITVVFAYRYTAMVTSHYKRPKALHLVVDLEYRDWGYQEQEYQGPKAASLPSSRPQTP